MRNFSPSHQSSKCPRFVEQATSTTRVMKASLERGLACGIPGQVNRPQNQYTLKHTILYNMLLILEPVSSSWYDQDPTAKPCSANIDQAVTISCSSGFGSAECRESCHQNIKSNHGGQGQRAVKFDVMSL